VATIRRYTMLYTTKVNGIALDIYYDCITTTDGYGTGDSPTLYEIEFNSIETQNDSVCLISILSESVLNEIEEEIIRFESGK